uniref:Uncharacterized protein AlNc14C47G3775 n=1 Tax=Albugo laibachii Nc14 TaxID=890382 RepID=F0WAR1_9STRA|nr:conserved hypothetical protein [Albugo laibachii Nc14]|eukprot:CCA18233.1 conserved hypothetical protein [Albugo laibachii Nc14]
MAEFLYAYACLKGTPEGTQANTPSTGFRKGLRAVSSMSSISSAMSTLESNRNERITGKLIEIDDFVTFGVRNVAVHTNSNIKMLDLYFEVLVDNRIMYTSEIVKNTLFPVWMPFQLSKLDVSARTDNKYYVLDRTAVRKTASLAHGRRQIVFNIVVYRVESGNWQGHYETLSNGKRGVDGHPAFRRDEVLRFRCYLNELVPLAIPLAEFESLPLNTWFFTLSDGGVHVSKRTFQMLRQVRESSCDTISCFKKPTRSLCVVNVKQGLEHRIQIITLLRNYHTVHDQVTQLSHTIQNGLHRKCTVQSMEPTARRPCDAKRESIKKLGERVHTLKEYVNCLEQTLLQEEKALHVDTLISKALVKLMHMNFVCKDEKDGILERRYQVLQTAYQIRYRQAVLVKALQTVYPIECNHSGECCIRGIRVTTFDLTNNGKGEEECISTALGYIAHLVFMLSKYFHIHLRYRVLVACSRSAIRDENRDSPLEYPLYRKGVEKDRYERAIQYLGMNVEQIIFARGLDNTKYTSILQRLKALMDVEFEWLEDNNARTFS